ncbi:hypothetical protein [Pseudarthrobacter sp. GA104]|uniref:hypothetical protein n=1 Tax=Pseudarthrobacter sp. GA104 TaxID=2676311 RepID=UPI0012FA2D62|nr:hypothetical protein [Pseudarthrobacter sp. GA104]MUU73489.1 hypothetical protein [Pseudarthrobacter sp. GA104]
MSNKESKSGFWSNMGVETFGPVGVLIIGFFWNKWAEGKTWEESLSLGLWIAGAVLVLVLFVKSFAVQGWREAVWVRLPKRIWGLKLTTSEDRQKLMKDGYDDHAQEIELQRSRVGWPSWFVKATQWPGSFWLYNNGAPVRNVRIEADPKYFSIGKLSAWPNETFDAIGRQFEGAVTEKGLEEGVTFTVTWIDSTGAPQLGKTTAPPDRLIHPSS